MKAPSPEDSPIDSLSKKLYSRNVDGMTPPRSTLREHETSVPPDWKHDHPELLEKYRMTNDDIPEQHTAVKKIFIFSVAFFVVAAGIATYMFLGNKNIVSSNNVGISVTGPVSIGAGENLALQIDVHNGNATTLQAVDLLVEYPQGTRDPKNLSKDFPRERINIGDILPGKTTTKIMESIPFGEEHDQKTVVITVEYRIQGSNAIFSAEHQYQFEISSAPLSMTITAPTKANAGQDVAMTLEVQSNATSVVKNVIVTAEYPFGFKRTGGSPDPSFDDNVWVLGDIEPSGKRTIVIKGPLQGQNGEERIFHFESGIQSDKNQKQIGTPFLSTLKSIAIERSFLSTDVSLNGSSDDTYVLQGQRNVSGTIMWRNNLPVQIADAVIVATITGGALDQASVTSLDGFYRSSDNTITWDKRTTPALALIDAGASGSAGFSFRVRGLQDMVGSYNPQIDIHVDVQGRAQTDDPTLQSVQSSVSKSIQVASNLLLQAQAVHYSGPIQNTGTLPPRVNVPTTYTIIWSLTNSSNDASQVRVSAILPTYMKWTGTVSPSAAPITYNSTSGEIVWNAGTVPAGTGYAGAPQEVAFQVSLTPSLSQVDTAPTLIGEATLQGLDRFTRTTIGDKARQLTTSLTTDPSFKSGDERVKP